ncbi:acyl-CoA/acyl-ACP dehydrogenase [Candidatus Bathyarchaeota archaeon]|nr:acyl-CoA/acyl-ACP dehydrogenase [Candidatus Bathyarchaeota archaeon]
METYPWWNKKHKKLAKDVRQFADENTSKGEEIMWTREFPSDLLKEVAEKGWFKAPIPKEYGGTNIGATGCCIIAEELSRVCFALAGAYITTIIGGTEQLLTFGNAKQRKRWLPKVAKGELLGAICISEPVVGSDAAGMETTAKRDGNEYVINGKKKFIINAGVADIYCLYAKTSDRIEDKAKYNHLSAFIVEKGTSGFTVERINELSGWFGLPNGYLDFNDVRVPVENRIGAEGDGWKVLVNGLNLERNLFAAGMLGPMREAIRYAVSHAQRRIQFGQPIINFQVNQFKIADMISRLRTARLLVYHTAHLLDMKMETVLEATTAKLFTSEAYKLLVDDAVQVMGGDGWTRFYPVESFLRDAKVNEMAAGTSEVMRTIIYRWGLKAMINELKMPHRQIHRKLGVPISTTKPQTITKINEKSILQLLAEDYRVNPSLYMSKGDVKERLTDISDKQLDKLLTSLKAKGLALLHKDKRGNITLAKATYKGLRQAKPIEYYKWFPEWIKKKQLF